MSDLLSLKNELEKKISSFKVLRDLSEFLKILDVNEGDILNDMLVKYAIESVGAERGSLLILDPSQSQLYYSICYIYRDQHCDETNYASTLKEIRFDLFDCVAGFAFRERETIVCSSTSDNPRYKPLADALLPVAAESAIYLPISVGNEALGVLEIVNGPNRRHLDESDAEILTIITNLVASAMENVRRYLWAISDPITKLYNTHYFRRALSAELQRNMRVRANFSVVMLDLDNFKNINTNWGYPMGDQVLARLGTILTETLRKDVDIPSRSEGDEFILLLPNTAESGAISLVNAILKTVRETNFTTLNGKEFNLTISAGIATFPTHGDHEEHLIENACQALRKAKENGKDRLVVYSP